MLVEQISAFIEYIQKLYTCITSAFKLLKGCRVRVSPHLSASIIVYCTTTHTYSGSAKAVCKSAFA